MNDDFYRTLVTIGDWQCSDGPLPIVDSFGCRWTMLDLTGWFDAPAMRSNPQARPGADGDYDGEPTLSSRSISISGVVESPRGVDLGPAMDRLSGLLSGATRYDTLTVNEVSRGVSRQAYVRRDQDTLLSPIGLRYANWSISLYASDPRRYSSDLHSVMTTRFAPGGGRSYDLTFDRAYGSGGTAGIVPVSNGGTVATWPVLRLAGPLTNPSVRLMGGSTVAATITLAAGQELVIDNGLRSVLLGNASRRQVLSADGFFALPAGDSQVYFSADSGAGTLTVEWRDAW